MAVAAATAGMRRAATVEGGWWRDSRRSSQAQTAMLTRNGTQIK